VSDATTSVSPLALARAAAQAARGVGGVVDLNAGSVGEFATYGGGEREPGVRAVVGGRPRIALRLVVAFGRPLPELTDEVRSRVQDAAAGLLGGSRPTVDVHVVDVALPGTPAVPPTTSVPPATTATPAVTPTSTGTAGTVPPGPRTATPVTATPITPASER
jgi:uncharacterized alkaline shock family protein YloU